MDATRRARRVTEYSALPGLALRKEVASRDGGDSRWVTTWSAAQAPPGPTTIDAIFGNDHSRAFENQTIRNIAHTSVGGKRVRVRLSNAFGAAPLRIGAAQVALRRFGASIYPQTNRRLTFGGQASIVVPVGAVAVSDAVDLDGRTAAADLAVSIYLPGATGLATFHEETMQTSYVAEGGNFVTATELPRRPATRSAFFLSVVEVLPVGFAQHAGGHRRFHHAGRRLHRRCESHLARASCRHG